MIKNSFFIASLQNNLNNLDQLSKHYDVCIERLMRFHQDISEPFQGIIAMRDSTQDVFFAAQDMIKIMKSADEKNAIEIELQKMRNLLEDLRRINHKCALYIANQQPKPQVGGCTK